MLFMTSTKAREVQTQLTAFMAEHVYPNELVWEQQHKGAASRWSTVPIVEALKEKAMTAGLWNLALPGSEHGAGLNNLEYAPLAEIMGRVHWSSEVFNCSAPDSGNMELLGRYGTAEQKQLWLAPLLQGKIRSAAQGRLGPGRIHHCMRMIGMAERALEKMCRRALDRVAFGKTLAEQSVTQERIAEARIRIDQARLLVLNAADRMDREGNRAARADIAAIKVATPAMLTQVVDWAIQLFGAAGVTDDYGLGYAYARARVMHFVDGPGEVHRNTIARQELSKYKSSGERRH